MRALFLGLLVAGLASGCAAARPGPNERVFDAGYDAVWLATLQAITNVPNSPPLVLGTIDKETGVLTTQTVPLVRPDEYSECKNTSFTLLESPLSPLGRPAVGGGYTLTVSIYVSRLSDTQASVTVLPRIAREAGPECRSRGKLEARLLKEIAAGLKAR